MQLIGFDEYVSQAVILVAEDEMLVRETLTRSLRLRYGKIYSTSSGIEALEVIKANPNEIQVVVSDVNMPGLDGIELAQQINSEFSNIKVILNTAYISDEKLLSAIQYGVSSFLVKPYEPNDVYKEIEKALASSYGKYIDKARETLIVSGRLTTKTGTHFA